MMSYSAHFERAILSHDAVHTGQNWELSPVLYSYLKYKYCTYTSAHLTQGHLPCVKVSYVSTL